MGEVSFPDEPPVYTVVVDKENDVWVRTEWGGWWPVGGQFGGCTWAILTSELSPLKIVSVPVSVCKDGLADDLTVLKRRVVRGWRRIDK